MIPHDELDVRKPRLFVSNPLRGRFYHSKRDPEHDDGPVWDAMLRGVAPWRWVIHAKVWNAVHCRGTQSGYSFHATCSFNTTSAIDDLVRRRNLKLLEHRTGMRFS